MSIHTAIEAARHHREEIIFGALTGLMSHSEAPVDVPLPRTRGSQEPQTATHFGQTIPQDTPTLLSLIDRIESGVDERGEFDEPTGRLLFSLGDSFRRHGLATTHYEALSHAISSSIERHLTGVDGLASLKDAVELACGIIALGSEEADTEDPFTARAKVLEVERRNSTLSVVRMHMDPPLKFAIGEALLARIPQAPMMWRPVYSSLPASPEGLIEVHVSCGPDMDPAADANSQSFLRAAVEQTQPGDEWILSTQPTDSTGARYGLHLDEPEQDIDNDRDLIIIAEGTGLAPARAAIMQQVMGGKLGASPATAHEDVRPDDSAPTMRRVHLFWGAQNPGQLYELQGLMGLVDAFDWLRFTPVVAQFVTPEGTNPSSLAGLPDTEKDTHATNSILTKGDVVPEAIFTSRNLPEKCVLLSGSPAFITRATDQLTVEAGVPATRIVALPIRSA